MSIQVGYIPRDISDFIYEVLCRDNTFPWFYQEQTSFYNGTSEVLQLDGYEGHPYFAHTIVTDNGDKCYCGKRGCVETVISGRALQIYYNKISGKKLFQVN